jgi:hypothetical protein
LYDPIQRELVSLVGGGVTSATKVQRLAEAMHESTQYDTSLAHIGQSGAHPSNAERDLHRQVRAVSKLRPVWWHVQVPVKVKRGAVKTLWWPICLPHVMFRALYEANMLHKLTPPGMTCAEFWNHCATEPWFTAHPAVARAPLGSTVPIRLHGDEGQGHRKKPVLVMNWSSCLCHGDSWDTRFLICVIPRAACIGMQSAQALCRAVAFSMSCLLDGAEPEQLPAWLRRPGAHKADIAHEMRGAFVGLKGDGKFFKEFIPSKRTYNSNLVCRLCAAHRSNPELLYTDLDGGWLETIRSHDQFMREARDRGLWSHFYDVPGWHLDLLLEDLLHVVFLGNGEDCAGSALWLLEELQHFPGNTADARFECAYVRLLDWCAARNVQCTASVSEYTKTSLIKDDFPHLGGKGADCKATLGFLADELQLAAQTHPGNMELRLATTCLYYLVTWLAILDSEPMFMSPSALAEATQAGWNYLRTYFALAKMCVDAGVRRWKVRPKCHALAHLLLRSSYSSMNIRFWSCWSDEDYIGKICKLARGTHPRTIAQRTLDRWLANLAVRWR